MSAFLYLVLLTVVHKGLAGFSSGAPCSERNTAYLKNSLWHLPQDPVQCVDITQMDPRTSMVLSHKISAATTLYSDHMGLSAVPETVFTLMPYLNLIDLSGNQLRRLSKDGFLPLACLQVLLLQDNRIVVPKKTPLLNSPSLKTLMLSNNRIRFLRQQTFRQLNALTVLYLDGNHLTRVSPKVFKPLKYLKYLHLGNNRLKVVPDIALPAPKAVVIVKGNPFNRTDGIRR